MSLEIENLKALIYGRELTAYQKALAINEWSKLQLYINDLEKLNLHTVSGIFSASDMEEAYNDGAGINKPREFDIENYLHT